MIKIPKNTEYVINKLQENGFEAYIVGGCVRDMLLGKTPFDFDVTTSAKPEEVISVFERTVPTGIKHGTVTVLIEKEPIEVTTFRTESGYSDSRHPENVNFVTSLAEDLSRRDFTVNAIAYNNKSGIIDCFGSMRDLESRILRAVGAPTKRFSEDALRILRLFRFASTLGFSCEEHTLSAALAQMQGLQLISRERIAAELKKAVCGKNLKAMAPLINSGGLEFIGIKKCPDFSKLERITENPKLSFFAFLYLAECDVLKVLNELKESNQIKRYCENILNLLSLNVPETKTDLKELLGNFPKEDICDFLKLVEILTDKNQNPLLDLIEEIITSGEPYLISHLAVNGETLNSIGISGKKIGDTLEILRKHILTHPEDNNSQKLLSLTKQIIE